MGFFSRLLVPRSARRVMHPVRSGRRERPCHQRTQPPAPISHGIVLPAGLGGNRQEPARLAGASNARREREDAVPEDVPLPGGGHPDGSQPGPSRSSSRSARRGRRLWAVAALVLSLGVAAVALPVGIAVRDGPTRIWSECCLPAPATAAGLARAHWSVLPPSPLGPRSDPILTWTGNELVELGGVRDGILHRDGAIFDPGRRQWRRIAAVPGSVGLHGAVAVWTGVADHRLFVTNGKVAGLYDPYANRWTTTRLPRSLAGRALYAPVSTGHDVILAAIGGPSGRPGLAVTAYNLARRAWRMITPPLPARHPPGAVSMVATWHRVILWSMWSRSRRTAAGSTIVSGVDVLVRRHGAWSARTGHWPQHRVVVGAAFAQFRILVPPGQFWCGPCPAPYSESPARFADPSSLALSTIPNSPLVTSPPAQPPIWLWNGNTVLAADASSASRVAPDGRLGGLAAYDRWSGRWYLLPSAPSRPALAGPPIFAEQQLLVLRLDGGLLALGKRS